MSLCHFPRHIEDKHCLVYCGPDRCNCRTGNPIEWRLQQARFGIVAKPHIQFVNGSWQIGYRGEAPTVSGISPKFVYQMWRWGEDGYYGEAQ